MTDAGGLRQARGARRIDQQSAVIDGDATSLVWRERVSVQAIQGSPDTWFVALAIMNPKLRYPFQIRQRRLKHIFEIARHDNVAGVSKVDTVRQRRPNQLRID